MPGINVTLDTTAPNTVRVEYRGRWTWTDFHAAYDEILALGRTFGGQPWYAISLQYDFTLPTGDAINHAQREFQRGMDAGLEHVVCVTDSALFMVLARLGLSMHNKYRRFLHVVRTEDEAYAVISKAHADAASRAPAGSP
jgi:hypothetical protein